MSAIICLSVKAQEEIIFDPSKLIPHEDGYYIAGVWEDTNEDGVPEHYNGCADYYEPKSWAGYAVQENHKESGSDQKFRYENCMIMPDCPSKYNDTIVPPIPVGYIQLPPCVYSFSDSASYSAIYTPRIKNLVSIELALSSDVSIQPGTREIPYNIDISKDNGATWEDTYFISNILTKRMCWAKYESGISMDFDAMINASKEGPVMFKIYTNSRDVSKPNEGQFVKVHYIKIVADLYQEVSIKDPQHNIPKYSIIDRNITSLDGIVKVYSYMGQLLGAGKSVTVPQSGIYVIVSPHGYAQKAFIR